MISYNIKGIAFDLEGTLINLEPLHHSAHLEVFRKVGLFLSIEEAIKKIEHFIGGPDRAIMEDVHKLGYKSLTIEYMLEIDRELYEKQLKELKHIPPREGVLDLLEKLKEKKIPYAIGSLTNTKNAIIILQKSKLTDYFKRDKIVLKEDVKNLKPAPDIYLETAKRMNIPPYEQLVFEDSHNGVKAAKAAGSRVIGMPIYYKNPTAIKKLKDAGVFKIFSGWRKVNLEEFI